MESRVCIPLDEYRALCAMEGRVNALHDLVKEKQYVSIDEALIILGFEEDGNAGKSDAD